jgi:hypothetical protein
MSSNNNNDYWKANDSSMAVVDNSASTSAILALFATLALADNSSSIAYTSVKIDALIKPYQHFMIVETINKTMCIIFKQVNKRGELNV